MIVDDRGRSTERGIVEFARKQSAAKAIQQIKVGLNVKHSLFFF